jgi:site-specific recombinase XerD
MNDLSNETGNAGKTCTDISHIQQLPGHNSIQTTMTYAKVAQKNLKKIKSPLDSL